MGNLCCAREHSVKFFVQFFTQFNLRVYGGPLRTVTQMAGPHCRLGNWLAYISIWCWCHTAVTPHRRSLDYEFILLVTAAGTQKLLCVTHSSFRSKLDDPCT